MKLARIYMCKLKNIKIKLIKERIAMKEELLRLEDLVNNPTARVPVCLCMLAPVVKTTTRPI